MMDERAARLELSRQRGHLVRHGFDGLSLSSVRFAEDGWFDRCSFVGADLRQATLDGAHFKMCTFRGADLRGASLRSVRLGGCDLRDARLQRADLTDAVLTGLVAERVIGWP
jgi:uncharacterized protein YjbI with pentapeptide repeats